MMAITRYIVKTKSGRYIKSTGNGDTVVENREEATHYSYEAAERRCTYGATMELA